MDINRFQKMELILNFTWIQNLREMIFETFKAFLIQSSDNQFFIRKTIQNGFMISRENSQTSKYVKETSEKELPPPFKTVLQKQRQNLVEEIRKSFDKVDILEHTYDGNVST